MLDQKYSISVHYYNYDANSFDPNTYPIPRFCSEYGLQSLPSADSFLKDTHSQSDLNINSDFMKYRQHHPSGNWQLLNMITQQMSLPDQAKTHYNLAVIYYSQVSCNLVLILFLRPSTSCIGVVYTRDLKCLHKKNLK